MEGDKKEIVFCLYPIESSCQVEQLLSTLCLPTQGKGSTRADAHKASWMVI